MKIVKIVKYSKFKSSQLVLNGPCFSAISIIVWQQQGNVNRSDEVRIFQILDISESTSQPYFAKQNRAGLKRMVLN